MLLEKIMTCVSERDENKAIEALHLAMTLLRNQPAVLQYYQEATTTTTTTTNKEGTDDCTSSIAYLLAGVLQRTAASSLIRLSSVADRAFVELLSVLSDKEKLQIIGSLLREWLENNEQKSAVRALFVCLSKAVASNVSRATLEATLDPTILIKGYNHTELVVRRACVQAIVEMYKILGEGFLMTYLAPSLRIDQVSLLRHYIGCSSSSSSSS
ncbi:hypothetical protein BDB00DRAFT_798584 [Zychaea mexicana]|uniref:uncharacterized protein n=1 Tax=Zychaea mexicana TaxID=64656 RepID=UPI0022FEC0C0|nr:uncharacterized protein BDB00DRAFT_798584 [Zychaea mexicana]KAI9498592.1 hypothetical protein BDB00DRAFT_798584 [Zychaea mexicana]